MNGCKNDVMPTQRGFSLVELSIVLVILGLLTGGVLGGRSLIKAAELRAVTTELQGWQTAVNTFRSKYMAVPGDMRNAAQFWPGLTNNGNGDGVITFSSYGMAPPHEYFLAWQHLALSGLIAGTYTGVAGPSGLVHHIPGTNCPTSKYGAGAWGWSHQGDHEDAFPGGWDFNPKFMVVNAIALGGATANGESHAPLFTPEEVWNIDTKMDDGKPGTGAGNDRPLDELRHGSFSRQ